MICLEHKPQVSNDTVCIFCVARSFSCVLKVIHYDLLGCFVELKIKVSESFRKRYILFLEFTRSCWPRENAG